jgi:hypothetical protein
MTKKYKLTKNFITTVTGVKLFQIKALKNFLYTINKGDLGGYIESENNLDQDGNAWVYGDAQVYDNAQVYGIAWVLENARVSGYAQVCGGTRVSGNAQVYGYAQVSGDAWVLKNARVGEHKVILFGEVKQSLNNNSDIEADMLHSFNLYPHKGKYILYKWVKSDLTSVHDSSFKYTLGKKAFVRSYDKSTLACSSGLHASVPSYMFPGDVQIACEVALKDIITVQEGKVRCRALKPIRIVRAR